MLGFNRWHLLKGLAAILCIVSIVWLALGYFIPAPPSTITIAMAFKGSSYERWALGYQERLSRSHVTLNLHYTDGPLDNLRLIKDQSSGVDVAFLFGGLTNSEQSPELISLGPHRLRAYLDILPWYGNVRAPDAIKGQAHRCARGHPRGDRPNSRGTRRQS